MTRAIFASSSIRCDCVCRRPAVSAISTSMPRAFADCSASNTTAAGSAPAPARRSATPLRSAQTASCSTAAARNVSPAASITESPSPLRRRASLPIVVVLPEPFTPTTRITYGFCARIDGERTFDRLQDREQRVGERRLERAGVRELGARDLAVQVRQDRPRSRRPRRRRRAGASRAPRAAPRRCAAPAGGRRPRRCRD